MKRCIPVFSFLLLTAPVLSQFQWVTNSMGIQAYNNNALYGGGISFYDFDKDGSDDLTFCINNDSILFYRNNGDNFDRLEIIPNDMDAKQPTWVDYDNDGDADFFHSVIGASCKLWRNDGNLQFTDVTSNLNLPYEYGETYGFSWGDYDNDSWLDVYICNYNWFDDVPNWLLHNNGDGTFTEVGEDAGVDNGDLPTYQSIWFDWNFDGWLDLYVINDKDQGNFLYQNNGDGTFGDVSDASGAGVALDSMCVSVTDFDRDGDWDIYITNTAYGNYFLRNDEGVFVNVAEELGVAVYSVCWGGLWIDYDNDGYDDLHVATSSAANGNQNPFFINDQDGTFHDGITELGLGNDDFISFSSAKGDYDKDGDWDFAVSNQGPANASLWRNISPQGHYVKLSLTGTASNRDAVGTVIDYYFNGQHHFTQTFFGDNYLSQDSQYEILSLGTHTTVDSLVLNWPSGWTDTYYNLAADQTLYLVEGETFVPAIELINPLCTGSTAVLDGGAYQQWQWNTEENTQLITISEPGIYAVEVVNSFGITAQAQIIVTALPAPQVEIDFSNPQCAAGDDGDISVSITGGFISTITWNITDETTSQLDSLPAGDYFFTLQDENMCTASGNISLTSPDAITADYSINHVSCYGENSGSVTLTSAGGTGSHTVAWPDGISPGTLAAGEYTVLITDENQCELELNLVVNQPDEITAIAIYDEPCFSEATSVILELSGGTGNMQADWGGANPEAIYAGSYPVNISDEAGCGVTTNVLITQNPEITAETTVLDANNGANGSALIDPDGGTPPYDYLWSTGSTFATVNALAQGTYTCTVTDDAGCTLEVEVVIIDVGTEEAFYPGVLIYPIPFQEFVNIELPHCAIGEKLILYDSLGRVVYVSLIEDPVLNINLASAASGLYAVYIGRHQAAIVSK